MVNRRLYKVECIHGLGTPDSEPLRVSALNLFHPTALPFRKSWFFLIVTQSRGEGEIHVKEQI